MGERIDLRIRRVRWRRYRIPFRAPFATAHGALVAREGVLLEIETDEGLTGLGECAPLPGVGDADALMRGLPEMAGALVGARIELEAASGMGTGYPVADGRRADAVPVTGRPTVAPPIIGRATSTKPAEADWARSGDGRAPSRDPITVRLDRGWSIADLTGNVVAASRPERGRPARLVDTEDAIQRPPSQRRGAGGTPALRPNPSGRAGGDQDDGGSVSLAWQAAVTTALLDLAGQVTWRPIATLLGGPLLPVAIPVNATVGANDIDTAAERARAAVAAGFGAIKLKVGAAESPDTEISRVAAVRAAVGPGVRLRLDANEAWTVEQAIGLIEALACYDIEYVEQPVAASDIAGLARVRQSVAVAIAADEAVSGLAAARALLVADAADLLIIKPTVVGGPLAAAALVELAQRFGKRVVVTSALESGVGLAAAAHVAAMLPQPALACGLATADLLASDLLAAPLTVVGGNLFLPAQPGLGVYLDWVQVGRYTTASGELA